MKKKIYVFLVVLASVIACTVCLAACNGGSHPAEYVGDYEFISITVESSFDGGEPETTIIEVGMPNVDKDFLSLSLKEDGTYDIVMSPSYMAAAGAIGGESGALSGKWSVSGGKLNLIGNNYGDGILSDNVLTFTNSLTASYGEITMKVNQEFKFKKVVVEIPET